MAAGTIDKELLLLETLLCCNLPVEFLYVDCPIPKILGRGGRGMLIDIDN